MLCTLLRFHIAWAPHGSLTHSCILPSLDTQNITFTCDEPVPAVEPAPPAVVAPTSSTTLLTLQGPGAYDAAVHCASVSAARRLAMRQVAGGEMPAGAGPKPGERPAAVDMLGSPEAPAR